MVLFEKQWKYLVRILKEEGGIKSALDSFES
jgi:hypothetical protein